MLKQLQAPQRTPCLDRAEARRRADRSWDHESRSPWAGNIHWRQPDL